MTIVTFCFWDGVSLRNPGWPQTQYVARNGLGLLMRLSGPQTAGVVNTGGGQRTTYGSQFFPFTMWVWEIRLGLCSWIFELRSHYGVQVVLELMTFLPQPPHFWALISAPHCTLTSCVSLGSPFEKAPKAGEMAQWLRALTALSEVLSSIPSNHMMAHNH